MGARIAPNAFATADGGDCTEALRRFQRAGGFAFGQSPKRAAIIPDSRRDVIFNTSYRRFLARRCCRFNGATGAAAGAAGGNTGGGTVAGGGGIAGGGTEADRYASSATQTKPFRDRPTAAARSCALALRAGGHRKGNDVVLIFISI